MISIQTNVAALYGLQNLQKNQMTQQNTIEQMTSGYRINTAADDPAGLAQANQLRNQNAELTQGVQNGNNAVGQLQIIDGGLSNISQILDRLKTLATEGASTTFTGNYTTLSNEFTNDITEITRQAKNIGLGTGQSPTAQGGFLGNLSVFIGGGLGNSNGNSIGTATESVNLSSGAVDATGLGLSSLSISDMPSAQAAISVLDAAVTSLGSVQGTVGAGINQLNFSVSLAQSQITNYSAAQSGLRDANMAALATQSSQSQVLMQSSMSALAQANQSAQAVLKLLQG